MKTKEGVIIENDYVFCIELLKKYQYKLYINSVSVVPGECFGTSPYFRIWYI